MDQFFLKALKTFRGTNGYIVAGQDFFTTNQDEADRLVREGCAIFAEESQNTNGVYAGQVVSAAASTGEQEKVYKISEMEREVTSMAKPVEIKVTVSGMNPDDVNVEIVRDEEVQAGTLYAEGGGQQGGYETQAQGQGYETQQFQPQETEQSSGSAEGDASFQPEDAAQANRFNELEQQAMKLEEELAKLRGEQNTLQYGGGSQGSAEQGASLSGSGESGGQQQVEVRHVGGGWYDLPNGERVQGKENAQSRMEELYRSQQSQGGAYREEYQGPSRQVGQSQFPNPDRVRQANYHPEDGVQLNAARYGSYQAGEGSGSLVSGSMQGGGSQGGQGNAYQLNNGDQRGQNAQFQARNSEGEFTDGRGNRGGAQGFTSGGNGGGGASAQDGQAGGSTGATGASGNTTGGASTAGNTRGGGSDSGGSGGANTSGNTGQ